MAKKNQIKARRSNTEAGQRVVNNYNYGTVNIDARQTNHRTFKKEFHGCTVNYPFSPATERLAECFDFSRIGATDVFESENSALPVTTEVQRQGAVNDNSEPAKRGSLLSKCAIIATALAGVGFVAYLILKG